MVFNICEDVNKTKSHSMNVLLNILNLLEINIKNLDDNETFKCYIIKEIKTTERIFIFLFRPNFQPFFKISLVH